MQIFREMAGDYFLPLRPLAASKQPWRSNHTSDLKLATPITYIYVSICIQSPNFAPPTNEVLLSDYCLKRAQSLVVLAWRVWLGPVPPLLPQGLVTGRLRNCGRMHFVSPSPNCSHNQFVLLHKISLPACLIQLCLRNFVTSLEWQT